MTLITSDLLMNCSKGFVLQDFPYLCIQGFVQCYQFYADSVCLQGGTCPEARAWCMAIAVAVL